MSQFERAWAFERFKRACEPFEIKDMEAAFDGDAEAAFSLSCALNNDVRGHMAVAMWRAKVPREAFRAYFRSAWDHDHHWVIDAAKTRQRLAYMFRYAAFPLPAEMPDVVRVWRGTSQLTKVEAVKGYSWTVDRDVACWFAMRFANSDGSPLVLAADVPKAEIALFTDERSEREAVLVKPPIACVDGDASDWRAGYERHESAMRPGKLRVVAATV